MRITAVVFTIVLLAGCETYNHELEVNWPPRLNSFDISAQPVISNGSRQQEGILSALLDFILIEGGFDVRYNP